MMTGLQQFILGVLFFIAVTNMWANYMKYKIITKKEDKELESKEEAE